MKYIRAASSRIDHEVNDILVARLAHAGYSGFEESEGRLLAYISADEFDAEVLTGLGAAYDVTFTTTEIAETNWNALWESNFQPVTVADFCVVRADFHRPASGGAHEIIITPKMSFGTGHHPTTYMMIEQMRDIDFEGKTTLDFGTGTGVLAILAEKLGAAVVTAIDNDEWSIRNAEENIQRNNCTKVKVKAGDSLKDEQAYEVILANITRNVIVDNLTAFAAHCTDNGILVVSGLMLKDEDDISSAASLAGFTQQNKLTREGWLSILFQK